MQVETTAGGAPVYAVGDVHGQFKTLCKALQRAELIGKDHHWQGKQAQLWFLGDLVDRGRESIAAIDLIMRLHEEAQAVGGNVSCLLGNHELMLLAAYRFGRRSTGLGSNFITRWKRNGGNRKDLAKLTSSHLAWLGALPMMARVGGTLLMHADAPLYLKYGRSVEEVNAAVQELMQHSDALAWEELGDEFAMRGLFSHPLEGASYVRRFLTLYGGERIVHGHTPICVMVGCPPQKVTAPETYADERCVNIDGGMFLGAPGFVYQLPVEEDEEQGE
ncbi:MAG TPA: metallophosphoesterase family protein [Ktedonobacteraceae bacterium]|jgi:hypothetical protein|nr:metallophosphoesterase family protein [Ktedonobacteraceae bacterium]